MGIEIHRDERDALWEATVCDVAGVQATVKAQEEGDFGEIRRAYDAESDLQGIWDDIGETRTDPRESFELTQDPERLATVLARLLRGARTPGPDLVLLRRVYQRVLRTLESG